MPSPFSTKSRGRSPFRDAPSRFGEAELADYQHFGMSTRKARLDQDRAALTARAEKEFRDHAEAKDRLDTLEATIDATQREGRPLVEGARLIRVCDVDGCIAPDHWRLRGSLVEEFAIRTAVDAETGCLLWRGRVNPDGYGVFKYGSDQPQLAHRVAYEIEYGPLPSNVHVHHGCRTRLCVRAGHLFVGSPAEHARMHQAEAAIAKGIEAGALYDELRAQPQEWPGWPEGDADLGAGRPTSPRTAI